MTRIIQKREQNKNDLSFSNLQLLLTAHVTVNQIIIMLQYLTW